MKFILLVEGRTEGEAAAQFLKRWVDPQLQQPVGVQPVVFDGYANLVQKMATKARMYLEGPNRCEIIAVIGLLDLYGPTFYPSDKKTAAACFEWGKAHFEKQVGLQKFRLFFAVHEFEAWALSQPEIFSHEIKKAFPAKIAQPESVNFDEPPAKLLDRIYRKHTNRGYKKRTYGKQLFAKLDPAIAVAKCPYLRALLEEMLALAKAAGL